jgi:murein DD-endopeptidase MepM/ murein hydrolase activator NlpD
VRPAKKALGPALLVLAGISLFAALLFLGGAFDPNPKTRVAKTESVPLLRITGIVEKGQSLYEIFKRHGFDPRELFHVKEALAGVHSPREFRSGQPYEIHVDPEKRLHAFVYWVSDDSLVRVTRAAEGYQAEKLNLEYERKILCLEGSIEDNLISSMGGGPQNLLLALNLSDIFAWDIDFTTALRKGDTYRMLVEGLYRDGEFRKYGNILAAEFVNDGVLSRAYRFEVDGRADYFDAEGRSLRKAFLKAPLSFRRVSSGFSKSRLHPVLKIRRAHNGTDYVAPKGTPVSAMANGQVLAAGRQGGYGNLVVIRHPNGYKTFYGHLSGFARGVRKGSGVTQGQLIGYVGSTGISTGPHLHFEMRVNDRPVNPRKVIIPPGDPVPEALLASFNAARDGLAGQLASAPPMRFETASR